MLKKRLLSAAGGLLILVIVIFAGSLPFFLFMSAVLLLGVLEFLEILPDKNRYDRYILPLLNLLVFLSIYLQARFQPDHIWPIAVFLLGFFIIVLSQIKAKSFQNILANVASRLFLIIYLTGGFSYLVFLRDFSAPEFHNTRALWLVLIASWLTDSGAYFVGNWLGKKPMAPVISPNKTIAGGIGGILVSVAAVNIYLLLLGSFSFYWLIFAPLIALAAIGGDLFESCLKRDANIKDTGGILPGHGGILDRFDSLLFSAPLTYYLLVFLLL